MRQPAQIAMSLRIFCMKHPGYRATKRKRKQRCETCALLYIFRWQNTREADERLGGLNPYQFIGTSENKFDDVLAQLKVTEV